METNEVVYRYPKNKVRNPKMGKLYTKVTYINKLFAGIPVKTMHKYRETYYGEVKDCEDCVLSR